MLPFDSIINNDSVAFLERYLNNTSPTGYEWRGQQLWLDYIKPYIDTYQVDNYGTAYCIINPDAPYRVVIEAHADEISWYVNYITEDGYIYIIRNGGSDHMIAPSKRVQIHTRDGHIVPGVFGWPAIHLRQDETSFRTDLHNLFIDVGCKKREEVEALGIHVGCVVTYPDPFMELNNRYFVGRALDNRLGGFVIAQVARLLKENNIKLPYGLYIVNSVQEEVGLRGAQMIVETIRPHVAIVTDVTHDTTTPMLSRTRHGDYACGKGPVLSYAPAIQNKLLDLMVNTAQTNDIPFQREANYRSTGTDADAFAFATGGVVTGLLSLPLKYMHTTVEMADKEDVANTIRLYYHTLQNIESGHDFKYIK